MSAAYPDVARDTRAVDLWERGVPHLTSGYLIRAPRPAIVDTGGARSVPVWLEALRALGVRPADIAYVIVTHIHLDHAGGVGGLLPHTPEARVVVHPRGARHLVDPSRLIAGARGVFGGHLETYFGVPAPVPEARLDIVEDGRVLDLGGGHRLTVIDAPGHARHQHMLYDAGSEALFSADELGEHLPDVADDYVMADTAPNQFDPDAMLRSAERLRELRPAAVLCSHYGRYPGSSEALYDRLVREVAFVAGLGRSGERRAAQDAITAALVEHVRAGLAERGIAWTDAIDGLLRERLAISAQGIADYHARRGAQRHSA